MFKTLSHVRRHAAFNRKFPIKATQRSPSVIYPVDTKPSDHAKVFLAADDW